ncbi:BrnT family toxin [Endozoicomonas euniceicola]|uniref:BrnT family toxin n=1 Tax=Endozoicomonas euniceicola TaxID=1234143 RepID=UPI00384E5283
MHEVRIRPHQGCCQPCQTWLSLSEAKHLEWDTLRTEEDRRFNYGEPRMVGYALRGSRLYCMVYTDRGESRRIISLRKSNNREVRAYANQD